MQARIPTHKSTSAHWSIFTPTARLRRTAYGLRHGKGRGLTPQKSGGGARPTVPARLSHEKHVTCFAALASAGASRAIAPAAKTGCFGQNRHSKTIGNITNGRRGREIQEKSPVFAAGKAAGGKIRLWANRWVRFSWGFSRVRGGVHVSQLIRRGFNKFRVLGSNAYANAEKRGFSDGLWKFSDVSLRRFRNDFVNWTLFLYT